MPPTQTLLLLVQCGARMRAAGSRGVLSGVCVCVCGTAALCRATKAHHHVAHHEQCRLTWMGGNGGNGCWTVISVVVKTGGTMTSEVWNSFPREVHLRFGTPGFDPLPCFFPREVRVLEALGRKPMSTAPMFSIDLASCYGETFSDHQGLS